MKNLVVVGMVLVATGVAAQQSTIKGNSPELTAQMNGQMAKRNTAVFEENKGQMKDQHWQPRPDVLFNGSAQGMHYYIRDNGMSYQLSRVESWKEEENERFDMPGKEKRQVPDEMGTYRVDVEWTDFNADFTVEKGTALDGYTNYYNVPEGVEPALFVKQYESVTLKELWPGIDLRCYSTDGMLETDWLVAAGSDYSQIRFEVKGAELSTDGAGHLIMSTPFGEIREGGLKVFQEGRQLEAKWVIAPLEGEVPGGVVSFEVTGHDPMLAMRIDPLVRVWGTYYGGTLEDAGFDCFVDTEDNVYLAGQTQSTTSIVSGGHQNTHGGVGYFDAFLVKFNGNGMRQWATYYGGSGEDRGNSCATDGSGNIYMAGVTVSTSAIASDGHQNVHGGGAEDAFLVKFNSNGVRQWSTYYGGGSRDNGAACAIDSNGNVLLAGDTESSNAIAHLGFQDTLGVDFDAFLVKFNSSGVRQWATYYGGSAVDDARSCATDNSGNVYLAGETNSPNAIASEGHLDTLGGDFDAFLVKFSANGVRQWGTYYGDNGGDFGYSCATDSSNNVFLTGYTYSTSAIASDGHQNEYGGENDAFMVKFNANGVRQWGTYYGGSSSDFGLSCSTDGSGNVYLVGFTHSTSAMASDGYQNTHGGESDPDAFLVKFNGNGVRQWGTYFGGSSDDRGLTCTSDGSGKVYLAGYTKSTTAISINGHQGTLGGGIWDAFLVKFNDFGTGLTDEGFTHPLLNIFPNPSHNVFTLVLKNASGDVQIIVTDNMGREVLMENFSATGNSARSIDMSGRASGIYFLRVQTENGAGVVKLVKE